MQGWVDLGGWLEMVYPHNGHPSWTNRARCWLTSLMRPTTLTTTPSRHPNTQIHRSTYLVVRESLYTVNLTCSERWTFQTAADDAVDCTGGNFLLLSQTAWRLRRRPPITSCFLVMRRCQISIRNSRNKAISIPIRYFWDWKRSRFAKWCLALLQQVFSLVPAFKSKLSLEMILLVAWFTAVGLTVESLCKLIRILTQKIRSIIFHICFRASFSSYLKSSLF